MSNLSSAFVYEFESAQLDALFSELNAKQLRSAWKAGMRPSAKVIQAGVLSELSTSHPNAAKYSKEVGVKIFSKGGGFSVGLTGVQVRMSSSKDGYVANGEHLYILRWLSAGTKERQTKKGYNRGHITGSGFFARGVEKSIRPAMERLGSDIIKSFERAVARARKAKEKTGNQNK